MKENHFCWIIFKKKVKINAPYPGVVVVVVKVGVMELKGRRGMRLDEVKRFVEWSWWKNFAKTHLGNGEKISAMQSNAPSKQRPWKNETGPGWQTLMRILTFL